MRASTSRRLRQFLSDKGVAEELIEQAVEQSTAAAALQFLIDQGVDYADVDLVRGQMRLPRDVIEKGAPSEPTVDLNDPDTSVEALWALGRYLADAPSDVLGDAQDILEFVSRAGGPIGEFLRNDPNSRVRPREMTGPGAKPGGVSSEWQDITAVTQPRGEDEVNPDNPLRQILARGDEREQVRESNFLRFLQSERNTEGSAVHLAARRREEMREAMRRSIAQDPQTGLPTTAVRAQVTNDLLTRGNAVGVPQGYVAEVQATSGAFNGITNPDAMSSYMENTDRFRRGIEVDAQGMPLGEDGLPLVDPQTGQMRNVRPMYTDTFQRAPQYFEDDVYLPVREMSPLERRRLQARMIRAGLAPEGAIPTGTWTQGWAQAFETVLGQANITGVGWGTAMTELENDTEQIMAGALAQARRDFEAQRNPYVAPSKATLQDAVFDRLEQELGRAPTSAELATLTQEMSANFRRQYDIEREAAMAQFGAGISSPLEAIPEDLRTDEDRAAIGEFGAQVSAEFGDPNAQREAVDPAASFDMRFREMFGGQMDIRDGRESAQQQQAAMSQRAGSVMRRLRGGMV